MISTFDGIVSPGRKTSFSRADVIRAARSGSSTQTRTRSKRGARTIARAVPQLPPPSQRREASPFGRSAGELRGHPNSKIAFGDVEQQCGHSDRTPTSAQDVGSSDVAAAGFPDVGSPAEFHQ